MQVISLSLSRIDSRVICCSKCFNVVRVTISFHLTFLVGLGIALNVLQVCEVENEAEHLGERRRTAYTMLDDVSAAYH